jgi:cation:H+ antiporter
MILFQTASGTNNLLLNSLLLAAGLVCLIFGGNWFVDGAAALARVFKVRPLIIGLVIIGFGTSAPETIVSVLATLENKGGLAIGNIVGSNIANIGLILAVSAIIFPVAVNNQLLRKEMPLTIFYTFWFAILVMLDGKLDWVDGILLLVAYIIVFALILRGPEKKQDAEAEEIIEAFEPVAHPPKRWLATLQTVVGLGLILLGASLTVDNASGIARAFGVSEAIIGLTIVSIGTSLPELVSSVVAALKRETDLIVGNVLGSNLFNLGFTGMLIAFISGSNGITMDNQIRFFSTGIMLAFTVLLAPLLFRGMKLTRFEASGCLVAYIGYSIWLFFM